MPQGELGYRIGMGLNLQCQTQNASGYWDRGGMVHIMGNSNHGKLLGYVGWVYVWSARLKMRWGVRLGMGVL